MSDADESIDTLSMKHYSAGWGEHTHAFSRAYPRCPCGRAWVVFEEEGRVTIEGEEDMSLTLMKVTTA